MIVIYDKASGRVIVTMRSPAIVDGDTISSGQDTATLGISAAWSVVADRDLSPLRVERDGQIRLDAVYPRDFTRDAVAEAEQIDLTTDGAIGAALHSAAPRGEETAIHRAQLQEILDTLGMKPTAKFARLTDIVLKSVVAGKDMKATKAG